MLGGDVGPFDGFRGLWVTLDGTPVRVVGRAPGGWAGRRLDDAVCLCGHGIEAHDGEKDNAYGCGRRPPCREDNEGPLYWDEAGRSMAGPHLDLEVRVATRTADCSIN